MSISDATLQAGARERAAEYTLLAAPDAAETAAKLLANAASGGASYPPLAFVDLETTGMAPARHRILEIGIVTVDGDAATEWSSLVNPGGHVPEFTRSFTGISDAMIVDAPRFAEIAQDVEQRLRGRLFIAHNAHFDHGFLRNEFRRLGIDFEPNVLCTVKLSRRLYPQFARHDLDTLMARHDLRADSRHRALTDARLIWQFWRLVHQELPATAVADAIRALLAVPALPPQLDPALIRRLPESPGAYVLYGERASPLYVGKAANLRQRVLAHLRADCKSETAPPLGRQVIDIEWHATSGALGARLKAAVLAQALAPAANRRRKTAGALCSWRLTPFAETAITELMWIDGAPVSGDLFGLFASERKAKNALRKLARTHALCHALLGLQKASENKPHLSCRVAECGSECARSLSRRLQIARFIAAAVALKIKPWPYSGAIGIREGRELHLADQWRYLGTARSEDGVGSLLENELPRFDPEIFRILTRWLPKCPRRLIAQFGESGQEPAPDEADGTQVSHRPVAASRREHHADTIQLLSRLP